MIKYGVLKLKKNSKLNFVLKVFMIFLLSFVFFGCKSKSVESIPVYTFDSLDDEAAMYIHIPPKENAELLVKFILKFYKGISQDDAELIVSKLDDMYASFGSRKNKKRIQIALEGKIPSIVKTMLKKQGFEKKSYNAKSLADSKTTMYEYFDSKDMDIAFPSSNQVLISQNVESFIDMFNMEKEVANSQVKLEQPFRSDWKECDLYKWISEQVPSIHFYIVRPQAFLTNLIGTDISSELFKLVYAKGNFSKMPNSNYELTLELEFQNERYIKPAISILRLALGLTDSKVVQTSKTHVIVSNVHINSNQLINMF